MSTARKASPDGRIEPTRENAELIQRLTLQDLVMGRFLNPEQIADPTDSEKVNRQLQKLRFYPEAYRGYYVDDILVAYLKQGIWRPADETSFTDGLRRARYGFYRFFDARGRNLHWGIFGLVALSNHELDQSVREEAFRALLGSAHAAALDAKARSISIVIHSNDPVKPVVVKNGYRVSGRAGEAPGAPGIQQLRYRRSV